MYLTKKELRGLSPNFYSHVFVIDWSTYFPAANRQADPETISIAHWQMNVEIRTVSVQFLFWEYLYRIFGIVPLFTLTHTWFGDFPDTSLIGPQSSLISFLWAALLQEKQWKFGLLNLFKSTYNIIYTPDYFSFVNCMKTPESIVLTKRCVYLYICTHNVF